MFEIIKKKANKEKREHWSIEETWKLNCAYNVVFGKRGNGKTYAWKLKCVELYATEGCQTGIIRRYIEDFRGKRGQGLFNDIVKNGVVKKYTKGEWTDVVFRSNQWFFARWDDDKNKMVMDKKPFCIAFALKQWEHDKSGSFPDIDFIVFEEFITDDVVDDYDEYFTFKNTVSTITRERMPRKIYLIGNTVNTDSGYFENMRLDHVHDMVIGEIDRYHFKNDVGQEMMISVEWTEPTTTQQSQILFDFDRDVRSKMIVDGEWQIPDYPHMNIEYDRDKDVLFTYFIKWRKDIIQCDIIQKDDLYFTFVHKRKFPLTKTQENESLIFSRDFSMKPNHVRNILNGSTSLISRIYEFFETDRVLYSSNKVGDEVNNYIKWCKAQ